MNRILTNLNLIIRYIDDILAIFDKKQDSLNFLDFVNKRHPNIKFTIKNKLTIPSLFLLYSFQTHTSNISQIDLYRPSLKF